MKFIILVGMIVVGLVFFIAAEFYISYFGKETLEYKYRSEAKKIVSLIDRVYSDPAKYLIYCQDITLSNISIKNGVLTYEKNGMKFSFLVPKFVNETELVEIASICIFKSGKMINLLSEKFKCNFDNICTNEECKNECPDCYGPAQICIGDGFCNREIGENVCNSPFDCKDEGRVKDEGEVCECDEICKENLICAIEQEKRCCPINKPKWCKQPKSGSPRCMSEDEYYNLCEKPPSFIILVLQMNTQVPNLELLAQQCKNTWVSISPLSRCPERVDVIVVTDKVCIVNECNALFDLLRCAIEWGYGGKYTRIVGIKHGSYVCSSGVKGYTFKNGEVVVSTDELIDIVCSHEFGHTFGLCDEGYGNSLCSQCDSGICNIGGSSCSGEGHCCPNKPEVNSIMCSADFCGRGCSFGNRFGVTSYAHLEKELIKYCEVGA